MLKKREFKVENIHETRIPYDGVVDKHLEYFFANKNNRHILVKNKVVNRKNQIIDRDLCHMLNSGALRISNKFRMRKSKPSEAHRSQFQSLQSRSSLNKTVGKKEFKEFLESQRN